jgi:xanthine dehydrogenase accessory factor
MNTIYEAIAEAVRRREAVALATIVQTRGSTPRQVGSKMLIRSDGTSMGTIGGGALEAAIIKAAQEALAEGKVASRPLWFARRQTRGRPRRLWRGLGCLY